MCRSASRFISLRRLSFFHPIAVLFALFTEKQGTTEHTEYTEARHEKNAGTVPGLFRGVGVFSQIRWLTHTGRDLGIQTKKRPVKYHRPL